MNPTTISDCFIISNNKKIYDFNKCLYFIKHQGKIRYGQSFKIWKEDIPIIFKLLIYMIKDHKVADKLQINLDKGILLSGPIGCGKTSIMHLLKPFSNHCKEYKIKTCREISFEFAKQGYEALSPYTQKSSRQTSLSGYCFDDLGAEQQIKHFGNDCNVMAEILITRYEHFIENKSITHITTNLSASEIENVYGNRLRSRMRNMFNVVSFESNSKDKR
ncbi:MAG: ATPase [Flavobacteriia bacterium]|mgnify:CR=1 FL=1|nr:ATPase [Flavobacteriia bacterium]NCT59108.1 ATPase [Flavobacteriia bacterium]OIP47377.1 MAG: ATPase [Flavobacteriaceae bacterium CG2_30_31_66]